MRKKGKTQVYTINMTQSDRRKRSGCGATCLFDDLVGRRHHRHEMRWRCVGKTRSHFLLKWPHIINGVAEKGSSE